MRRLLAIAMMLVLVLPLAAPALGQGVATRVPICCRLGGVHKCLLHAAEADAGAPMLRERCAAMSQAAVAGHAAAWTLGAASDWSVGEAVAAMRVGQAEAGWRISFGRSRQKRGPPVTTLS